MYFRALKFLSYFIEMALFGLFGKTKKENLNKGLEKTKESVFKKLARVVVGKSKVDDEVLDNLEEVLITSDVGVETTVRIIERIEERVQRDKYMGVDELNRVLKEEIVALLKENTVNDAASFELPENGVPYVIMVVGVNGVGKTTTIGKLAYKFKEAGKKVVLGAADTFRAAAVDQLVIWADRVGVPIVKQAMGADPASVAYDTLSKAKADGAGSDQRERYRDDVTGILYPGVYDLQPGCFRGDRHHRKPDRQDHDRRLQRSVFHESEVKYRHDAGFILFSRDSSVCRFFQ